MTAKQAMSRVIDSLGLDSALCPVCRQKRLHEELCRECQDKIHNEEMLLAEEDELYRERRVSKEIEIASGIERELRTGQIDFTEEDSNATSD